MFRREADRWIEEKSYRNLFVHPNESNGSNNIAPDWSALELSMISPTHKTIPCLTFDCALNAFRACIMLGGRYNLEEVFPVVDGHYVEARTQALAWLRKIESMSPSEEEPSLVHYERKIRGQNYAFYRSR